MRLETQPRDNTPSSPVLALPRRHASQDFCNLFRRASIVIVLVFRRSTPFSSWLSVLTPGLLKHNFKRPAYGLVSSEGSPEDAPIICPFGDRQTIFSSTASAITPAVMAREVSSAAEAAVERNNASTSFCLPKGHIRGYQSIYTFKPRSKCASYRRPSLGEIRELDPASPGPLPHPCRFTSRDAGPDAEEARLGARCEASPSGILQREKERSLM